MVRYTVFEELTKKIYVVVKWVALGGAVQDLSPTLAAILACCKLRVSSRLSGIEALTFIHNLVCGITIIIIIIIIRVPTFFLF